MGRTLLSDAFDLTDGRWLTAESWVAVAEKVGVVETASDFFKKCTNSTKAKAAGEGLMRYLRTAPNSAPEPEDRLR